MTTVAVSGTSTKTITLTRADASTVTTTWTDIDTDTNTYVTSAGFSGGTLTLTRNDAGTVTVSLDGRYYLATNPSGYITSSALSSYVPTSGYSFGTAFTLGTMYVGTGAQATVSSLLGVYSNGYAYTFGASAVQSWLGLGSLAYSSATIPTNNNQLTNGAGYITGISSGNVTTALGYTPVTNARTITINGTGYDLSADRSWTITATETDTLSSVVGRGNTTGGNIISSANMYASVFYDYADNGYYLDANSYSSLWGLAIRGDNSGTGTTNQITFWGGSMTTTSAIGFKSNGAPFTNPTGNGDGYNTYLTMDTVGRGWVFRRGTGGTDFSAAYTSGWILNNGIWQANASMRAPIFYDSEDTSYYVDPNSISRMNTIVYDNLKFSGDQTYGLLGRNAYVDTINGRGSDPLELNYYDGGSVIIGTGANGSKALYAGSLYDAGNRVAIQRGQSNWNDSTVINYVNGMLAWKNYGNSHVIFDASASTTPSGGGCSSTNSTSAWTATYPTLMGWNGSQTYGVRVDSARISDSTSGNAATATYATSAGSAPNAGNYNPSYGVNAGEGNGLKFWNGSDTYKISMGNGAEYHYGPVTDYSIKTAIDSVGATRGFTWGVNGATPVAGLNVGNGNMQIAGYLRVCSNLYIDANYGCTVTGVYASTRYQGIWNMGTSWSMPQDGTTPGNLYGLAWSHPNAGGQAGYLATHGLLVMENGSTNSAISNGIWTRGDVTAYSDARVKDNIEVIENAVEKIKAIRGVTFTRNDREDTTKRFAGVIAQEVLEVLPEVVTEDALGTYSVAYGNLNALLIEAIKEQQKEIDELKSLINGLTK